MNLIEKLLRKSPRNGGKEKFLRTNRREYLIKPANVCVADIGISIFADFFADHIFFIFLVSELEIKAQKDNFEKQSYAIKSDAEVKLAEVQALLEAERDRCKIEVTRACLFKKRGIKSEERTLGNINS